MSNVAEMKHAAEVNGPFLVHLVGGDQIGVAEFDGGGMDFTTGSYEVHGYYIGGGFAVIPQASITKVTDSRGEELEFGNPYMPGHPRPQELDPAVPLSEDDGEELPDA